MDHIDNTYLEGIISRFDKTNDEEDGQKVAACFQTIAEKIVQVAAFPPVTLGAKDDKEVAKWLVLISFHRLHHYNSEKGKAFNYFATVMLNYLRKEHQRWQKRTKLEQMYGRYVDGNTMEE